MYPPELSSCRSGFMSCAAKLPSASNMKRPLGLGPSRYDVVPSERRLSRETKPHVPTKRSFSNASPLCPRSEWIVTFAAMLPPARSCRGARPHLVENVTDGTHRKLSAVLPGHKT